MSKRSCESISDGLGSASLILGTASFFSCGTSAVVSFATWLSGYALVLTEKLDFDAIDYRILGLLAQKVKTKDMPMHLNLSLSTIEKRKVHIKNVLLKDKGGSKEIVAEAIRIGLL